LKSKLLSNSFIFVIGDIINKGIPFLMLPILTRYLTPEDYGIVSIFTVIIAVLSVFTGLNVHGAININFFKMDKRELKNYIGNVYIILAISSLIVLIILSIFSNIIINNIELSINWVYMALLVSFFQFTTNINLLLWVAEQKSKQYIIYQIMQTILITTLSLIFIIKFNMKWEGQILATTIGILTFSMISFIFIIKRGYFYFKLNFNYIKDALYFGIPLIPHTLSGWIKTGSDRILLVSMVGASATGIYSVGYQIGYVIGVVVLALNKVWTPYLFKILSDNPSLKDKERIVKFTYIYFIFIILFAILFSYIAQNMVYYFLDEKFIESIQYIKYFALAFAFQGMYFMVTNYIFYVKKTYILSYITFSTAVIHVILLYVLININGTIGAAQATLISFVITFFATWYLSNKVYSMPWNNNLTKRNNKL